MQNLKANTKPGGPVTGNLTWQRGYVAPEEREARSGHRACVLWLTGLSGAGKSTIARAVERRLFDEGRLVKVLDGDNVRHGLNRDLGFSPGDRAENLRRVAEVAGLFREAGFIVLTAFISPYRREREQAAAIIGGDYFHEVYVQADLELCKQRDPKGLYRKALSGDIENFTGVSDPFEEPARPDLTLNTGESDLEQCARQMTGYLERQSILPGPA